MISELFSKIDLELGRSYVSTVFFQYVSKKSSKKTASRVACHYCTIQTRSKKRNFELSKVFNVIFAVSEPKSEETTYVQFSSSFCFYPITSNRYLFRIHFNVALIVDSLNVI